MSQPNFGYLASLTPVKDTKEVLHVADANNLVEGKLYITHKNPGPARIRVGTIRSKSSSKTGRFKL